jgi:hypothetical protein
MRTPSITTKVSPETLRALRVIAAATGEQQVEVTTRLVEAELKRLRLKLPRAIKPEAMRRP